MQPLDTLAEPLDKLYSRINYERHSYDSLDELKLQNMFRLMSRLDDPHLMYPTIHIAGTKGKGSVSAMIGQVLTCAGRRTGVYSSPHLEAINQRIAIDGKPISDADLANCLTAVEKVAEQLDVENASSGDARSVTFFEAITATAFLYFAQQQVDVVILEVGMGGRLDSTNVCQPVLTIITSISFDHTQHLGNTLAKIAAEKAGIIKPRVPLISGVTAAEPAEVITDIARLKEAPLYLIGRDFDFSSQRTQPHQTHPEHRQSHDSNGLPSSLDRNIDADQTDFENHFSASFHHAAAALHLDELKCRLLGEHQHHNGAICLAAIGVLNLLDWNVPVEAVRAGIETAFLPGRTEIVQTNPLVMLDVAHNPASIQALVATLKRLKTWGRSNKKVLILAISKDKDHKAMLEILIPHFDVVLLTQFLNNPRSREPESLRAVAEGICRSDRLPLQLEVQETPSAAYQRALHMVDADGFICIAGSVYLVAEMRQIFSPTP